MSKILKGMVVELISGGPTMAVSDIGDYSGMGTGPKEGAMCVWFDEKKVRHDKVFDTAVLKEHVDRSSGSMRITRG